MLNLKANYLYKSCQNGCWLLIALFLTAASWFFYDAGGKKIGPQIAIVLILVYVGTLLLHQYGSLWRLLLSILILFLFASVCDFKKRQTVIGEVREVKVEPDQIKINGDWLSGIAQTKSSKILIAGKVNSYQKEILQKGKAFVLTQIKGKTEEIGPATNLGEFDFKRYYNSKNIKQRLLLQNFSIQSCSQSFQDSLHSWRFSLQQAFKKMPPLLGFFASELILAENNRGQRQTVIDSYCTLGIIHLLSISGLHVGLYTLLVSKLCFYFKFDEEETFAFCLVILGAGIFLSAGQAGFIRASLTYLLRCLTRKFGLKMSSPDLLGLTCVIHLLLVPHLFLETGAILSYELTFGLQITNSFSNLKRGIALNALITPLLLFYFYQVNLLTVLFNIFAVPYFNYFVMPLSWLGFCLPASRQLLEKMLTASEKIVAQIANTKMGLLTFGKINWWQTLLLLGGTSLLLILCNENKIKQKQRRFFAFLIFSFYLFIFASIHFPLRGQVTLIDVGQGDSILITTPFERKVYMIDTGGKLNFSGRRRTPQVNRITLPLLKAQGISKIDGLFVTHQDADHVGDVSALLDQVQVKRLYMAKGLIKNPAFKKRLDGHLHETQLVEVLAGAQIQDKGLNFQVLAPFHPGKGENKDSLCLTFRLQDKNWLFTGDLGQEGEKKLLQAYPHLRVDYFKLGHHGSKTASNPAFLRAIKPELVFISAGRHNRFGHPHQQTLATLKKLGIPWVSTQDCGMISWYYDYFHRAAFKTYVRK